MSRIASFRPGVWNGVPVSAQDLRDMVRNFAALSAGADPWHSAYVSLNHDDGLSFGRVPRAELDRDGVLWLDAADMPAQVGAWVNSGQLQAPSIEFWEPGDFPMPDGTLNRTRVLKCLTLLGNNAPGVKGLGRLPVAKFHHAGKARTFSSPRRFTAMDRTAMLQALKTFGMDVGMIPSTVPDAVLESFLKATHPKPPDGDDQTPNGVGATDAMIQELGKAGVTLEGANTFPDSVLREIVRLVGEARAQNHQSIADAIRRGDLDTAAKFADRNRTARLGSNTRTELLKATPMGRSVLAAEKVAAGNPSAKFADNPPMPAWRREALQATPMGRAALQRLKKK